VIGGTQLVYCFHQRGDAVGRRELADAVTQVENMTGAFSVGREDGRDT
jgi:hypothetical protein